MNKVYAYTIIFLLVLNIILFAAKIYGMLTFWSIIILAYLFVKYEAKLLK